MESGEANAAEFMLLGKLEPTAIFHGTVNEQTVLRIVCFGKIDQGVGWRRGL